jgi:aryl-alcohol dehydrogenase-like predicted oxidoreductase
MDSRRIGNLEVSLVGLGCNNFGGRLDPERTKTVVDAALDAGVTFFDTADVYGAGKSEEFLGAALGARRKDIVLATKFGTRLDDERHGASPAYVKRAVEDSLRRLQTDWIDFFQLHRPDPETPIADTLGALDELIEAGTVREIGCSNFTVEQLDAAAAAGGHGFAGLQNEYSLIVRDAEDGELAWCATHDIAFVPFFPLFSGLLTGKYRRGEPPPEGTRLGNADAARQATAFTDENFTLLERLEAYASDHGHTVGELAIAWLLAKQPIASVIAGATRPEQVVENVAAATWTLSANEVAEVDALGA